MNATRFALFYFSGRADAKAVLHKFGDGTPGNKSTMPRESVPYKTERVLCIHVISILAPCERGRQQCGQLGEILGGVFQSTLPVRGGTKMGRQPNRHHAISTHAPHKGSDILNLMAALILLYISTHAPHEGSDVKEMAAPDGYLLFQSTLPTRGSTSVSDGRDSPRVISIHTPREESDSRL